MKGFFSKTNVNPSSLKPTRKLSVSKKYKNDNCEMCGLYRNCKSPRMPPTGDGRLGILIVAEASGKTEDQQNMQLVGEMGQLLREHLSLINLDLDLDFWKTNAVICRPMDGKGNNRTPTRREIGLCRPNLLAAIEEYHPKFIWLMGAAAIDSFYWKSFTDVPMSSWVGHCVPEPEFGCWVIPMYHPSFVGRMNDRALDKMYHRTLKWALSLTAQKGPVVPFDYSDRIKVLTQFSRVCLHLGALQGVEEITFDYETNAISPYGKDRKMLMIGISEHENAVAFPFDMKHWTLEEFDGIRKMWCDLLANPKVKKTAHNLKFEDGWSRVNLGVEPRGWIDDSMVTQHVLNCSPNTVGLKFQAHVRWGIPDYGQELDSFMMAGSNGLNSLMGAGVMKLGTYCATDALLADKLVHEQRSEIEKEGLQYADDFFFEGGQSFCETEANGISVDSAYFETEYKRLTKQIDKSQHSLFESQEALEFQKKNEREIDLNSVKDMRELLFDIMNLRPTKLTSTLKTASVDQEALEKIKTPFTELLLYYRKLVKARDTYLAQFRREVWQGKIHPSFNLHTTRTYRSSCNSPNFQNLPIRDEEITKSIRSGIMPSPGNRLLDVDYSQLEFRIATCFARDPVMVAYINDPSTDIHRDQAQKLFLLGKEEVSKEIRFYGKNGFVFPELYGSYWKSCASDLWDVVPSLTTASGVSLVEHLLSQGIQSQQDFTDHVKDVETDFWKDLSVYREWQKVVEEFYAENGYVEMFFGFRRGGYMKRNEQINTPIQGTAFHCLLWSFIRINKIRKRRGWKSKMIAQIHDDILFDLVPEEAQEVLTVCEKVMTKDIRQEFKWIIVPLAIEAEVTPINGSWFEKKAAKRDSGQWIIPN